MIFRRNGARKRDSREHHRFSDAPPGGTNEPPEKCARAPGTQKKTPGPRRGPRDPARSPPGSPGAPPGDLCRACNAQFPAPGVTWICKVIKKTCDFRKITTNHKQKHAISGKSRQISKKIMRFPENHDKSLKISRPPASSPPAHQPAAPLPGPAECAKRLNFLDF